MHHRALRAVPILRTVPEESLGQLEHTMKPKIFAPGEYAIRQNDLPVPDECFFVVCSGDAVVTTNVPGLMGKKGETETGKLGPGDYFGEKALLASGERRTENVRAGPGHPLRCLALSKTAFEVRTILNFHPLRSSSL